MTVDDQAQNILISRVFLHKQYIHFYYLNFSSAAIRKMRSQERQKRYAAQKKAQELLVKQRMLQQQRGGAYGTTGTYGTAGPSGSNFYNPNSFSQSPIIQEIPVQRTPIIKNGKIIGYGIPITDPSQLPSQTPPPIYDPQSVPSVVYPKIGKNIALKNNTSSL